MTKTRIKKIFLAILSALMFICMLFGVGQFSITAKAETIMPAGVADTHFKIVGGTYGRIDPDATSPDGVKFNVIPTKAGTDVTLTMLGAHRKYYGDASGWWSGRMRFGNTTEIEARITTLRSPANQNYEISFVTTVKGVYISLTSDIVMKEGAPYINGSDVALEPVQTGDTLSSGVLDFRPTTKAGVVGSTPDCTVRTSQMFKLGPLNSAFSNFVLTDKATLDALLVSVPEKYRERYTIEWVNELCKDFGANDDLLEFRFIGVPATGTTLTVYELNGQVYDKNPESTSGTKQTSFQSPRPILVQKDSYAVFEAGAEVNLNSLLEKWCPVEGITTPNLNTEIYHTTSTYNCEWTDGTTDNREQINPITGKAGDDIYSFDPNHHYNINGIAYFALKDGTNNGTPAGQYGTYYFFARWNLVSQTNELLTVKTDTLKWGREYCLNEVFAVNQDIASMSEDEVYLKGYLNTTTATGTEQELGSLSNGTLKVTEYDQSNGQYSVCITVYKNSTSEQIAYSVFNFTIDPDLPTITYNGLPLISGVQCDLNLLFSFSGAELTSYNFNVNGVDIPDGKYQEMQEADTCTVFCEVTDSRGFKANTTIQVEVIRLGLVNEISKEIEKEVVEYFADPALPYEGISYTTKLYKATDNVETATPLTMNSEYVFTESGAYKLLYTIYIASIDQTITYTTEYNVTIVEQRPTIALTGTIEEVYYTGSVVVIPKATATNTYASYDVDIAVRNGDSNVSIQNGAFQVTMPGNYEIVYSTFYGAAEPVQKSLKFTVLDDNVAPEIYVYGTYAEKYEVGKTIAVLTAFVVDNSGADIIPDITVTKNGEEISPENGILVLENGTYSILYTATDAMGLTATKEFNFTVGDGTIVDNEDDKKGCKSSIENIILPMMLLIPFVVLVAKKKEEYYD